MNNNLEFENEDSSSDDFENNHPRTNYGEGFDEKMKTVEDLEASVKKHALGFAEWLNIHEYMLINKIWFHIGHVTNLTTEKLFDNYLRKLRE